MEKAFALRTTKEVYKLLEKKAKEDKRSVNQTVNMILENALKNNSKKDLVISK